MDDGVNSFSAKSTTSAPPSQPKTKTGGKPSTGGGVEGEAEPVAIPSPQDPASLQPILTQPPPAYPKRRESVPQQPSTAAGFFSNSSNSINQIVNQASSSSTMRKRSKGGAKNSRVRGNSLSTNSGDVVKEAPSTAAPAPVAAPARPSYTPSPAISDATSSSSAASGSSRIVLLFLFFFGAGSWTKLRIS